VRKCEIGAVYLWKIEADREKGTFVPISLTDKKGWLLFIKIKMTKKKSLKDVSLSHLLFYQLFSLAISHLRPKPGDTLSGHCGFISLLELLDRVKDHLPVCINCQIDDMPNVIRISRIASGVRDRVLSELLAD
jgi:hypothetical protein